MFDFDIRSAMMIGAFLNVLIAVMLFFVRGSLPKMFQESLRWWWAGLLLQPAGFALIAMRDHIPEIFSIVLANTLINGGIASLGVALRIFNGVPQRRFYASMLVMLSCLSTAWFSMLYDSLLIRIILISFLNALLLVYGARALLRRELKTTRVSQILVTFFIVAASSTLSRGVYHLVTQESMTSIFSLHWTTVLSYGLGSLLPIVGSIGFLLMCTERSQKELERMASEDPLTGAYNRRAMADFGKREMTRSRRHGKPLSVILMDIDYFKKINDELGHAAGDIALIETVSRLKKILRHEDYLGRMGGEEFLVLLPDTDAEQAKTLAQRIQDAFSQNPMQLHEQQRVITLSGGMTLLTPTDNLFDDMLRRADDAMYSAKSSGRNRMHSGQEPVHAIAIT